MATKTASRADRWNDAVEEAKNKLADLADAFEGVVNALSDLKDIQQEYADWYDNMPDALTNSPTGEKLAALLEIELELDSSASVEELQEAVDNAEGADLPLGWGRD